MGGREVRKRGILQIFSWKKTSIACEKNRCQCTSLSGIDSRYFGCESIRYADHSVLGHLFFKEILGEKIMDLILIAMDWIRSKDNKRTLGHSSLLAHCIQQGIEVQSIHVAVNARESPIDRIPVLRSRLLARRVLLLLTNYCTTAFLTHR